MSSRRSDSTTMLLFAQFLAGVGVSLATAEDVVPKDLRLPKGAPCFQLVGDSTTVSWLGWGTCFIKHLTNGATGAIHAAPGQTTHTFISEGLWAPTLEAVRNSAHCSPVMTISFSHNDQGKMKIEQFKTNLGGLYDDATKAGAEVIFVSSLSRRNFAADGSVERELAAWAAAMGEVAASKNANFVDFNTASADLIEAAGEAKARTWDRSAKDFTHINDAGCAVFGGLLANMTRTQIPALAPYISADGSPTTSGFAATPTVDTAKCKRGKVKRT